jgi:hypothetical protein
MKVKTRVGEIEALDLGMVGPRTRFWAEALQDLVRPEEVFGVLGAALDEAYRTGAINAVLSIKFKGGEIVDAEATVVVEGSNEEGAEDAQGPEPEQPDVPSDGSGPAEPPTEAADVSGRVPEGAGGIDGDQEKVEETP